MERDGGDSPAPVPAAPVGDGGGLPASREQLLDLLADLRLQGVLGFADEAALLRSYDSMLAELREARCALEAAFRDRIDQDGLEQAEAWLRDEAQALGRRQGEQMRRLVASMPGLATGEGALSSPG